MLPSPFAEQVLDLVAEIPPGKVLSYGAIAARLGHGGARSVGTVMATWGSGVPWHRVVRADGRLPAGHENEARSRLRAEGTPFVGDRVDMVGALWTGVAEIGSSRGEIGSSPNVGGVCSP